MNGSDLVANRLLRFAPTELSLRGELWRSNLLKQDVDIEWQKTVANRLLRFARNDSSLWNEMRSGAVELLAMTP